MSKMRPRAPEPQAEGHSFAKVPTAQIQRSRFDLSHSHKTTFDAGLLIPVLSEEVLPGDTFNVKTTVLARLLTPLFPIMDDLYMDLHWWFVPNRLVWSNWQKFQGEQENPGDSTAFTVPRLSLGSTPAQIPGLGSLVDYFGLPITPFAHTPSQYYADALRFRAYNLIYNQWYRDQNQQDSVTVRLSDSGDLLSDYTVLRRGKRHDYFTSALPWPQKGDAVTIPLGGTAPVTGTFTGPHVTSNIDTASFDLVHVSDDESDGGANWNGAGSPPYLYATASGDSIDHAWNLLKVDANSMTFDVGDGPGTLVADLSLATATTINALRQSIAFQQVLERDARGGTRYVEMLRAHFGVISPDARLQRPEFLGAQSAPIQLFSVPQTAPTSGSPQGNLAAYGISTMHGNDFVHSFTEHGHIIGIMSVRAPYTYTQRIDRSWTRQTRFDYYLPALAMLGEQGILMQELFATGQASHDTDTVFGYQERWAEYRTHPSLVTGLFRMNVSDNLAAWHLAQELDGSTVLNEDFIVENPPVDRISAVEGQPHFKADIKFQVTAVRPLPVYSVPGLMRL